MNWLILGIAALPYADRWVTSVFDDRADTRTKEAAESKRQHDERMKLSAGGEG